jgi:hypothetical protein
MCEIALIRTKVTEQVEPTTRKETQRSGVRDEDVD